MNEQYDASTRIDFEAQHRQYLADCRFRYSKAIESLPPRLMALGVAIVTASYSGCGDSGQFDEVEFLAPTEELVASTISDDLEEEVQTFLYDALESRHGGWENNEGGEGEFRWVLATNGLHHTHRDLYVEAETTEHTGFDDMLAGKGTHAMTHPLLHSQSSVKAWGGKVDDYLPIHNWFDATKETFADARHRALRHHAQGIFEAERVFGVAIVNSDGRTVPVRLIGERHVREDMGGLIPSVSDWLSRIRMEPWMNRGYTVPDTERQPTAD